MYMLLGSFEISLIPEALKSNNVQDHDLCNDSFLANLARNTRLAKGMAEISRLLSDAEDLQQLNLEKPGETSQDLLSLVLNTSPYSRI